MTAWWRTDDDEPPIGRMFRELSDRWEAHSGNPMPVQLVTPLADVAAQRVPEPMRPLPSDAPSVAELSIRICTSDGVPCSGVELQIVGHGVERSATTDGSGILRMPVPAVGSYEIHVCNPPLRLPPAPAFAKPLPIWTRKIGCDTPTFSVTSQAPAEIVVMRPCVTEIVLDGWAQASCVMRWGGTRVRKDGTIGTTRAALRLGLWLGRGKTMCVTGHADPKGSAADNTLLAAERAKSVQLFASGDLRGWAEHAHANATDLDLSCAMIACARILGMAPFGLDDDDAIEAAFSAVRAQAQISDDAPGSADDWFAIAELYDADLALLLQVDRAGLASIRSSIAWTSPPSLALGERWPRPLDELAQQLDGVEALAHRRCTLAIFGPYDAAQMSVDSGGDVLYDGSYQRTCIDPPGEALVEIAIDTPSHDPIARGRAWIKVADLGAFEYTADPDGVIRFMTLHGDPISITAAFDAHGRGTLISGGADPRSVP